MKPFQKTYSSLTVLFLVIGIAQVEPHGRLIEPPSRSSAWRYGFNTTANYDDHQLYCGGFSVQYQRNNGKCGICGDAYDVAQPRPNEAGGVYGQGVLVRKYRVDSIIRIKVELTAYHKGYFEFRLCPNNNIKKIATQKCLDTNILQQSNGDGARYYPSGGAKVYDSRYLLPRGLTCTQCVLQWRYIAGNNWGQCENGTQAIGCGPQEEFRACADVSITDSTGHAASGEDESVDDNEIGIHKFDGGYTPVPDTPSEEESALPFVMAVVGMLVAGIAFGALFGWFYRREVIQFARNHAGKPTWKVGNVGAFVARRETRDLSPTCYSPNSHYPPHTLNGRPSVPPPPVPPPRNKKTTTSDLCPQFSEEEYHNQRNMRPHLRVTPDIISQPSLLSVNGLSV